MFARTLVGILGLAVLLAQTVQFRTHFVAGDVFKLEILQSVEDTSRPTANFSTTTAVQVTVVSTGPTGSLIEWLPTGTVRRNEPDDWLETKRVLATMLTNNLPFRFDLDSEGHYRSLVNAAELGPKMIVNRDALLEKARAALPPDEDRVADLRKSLTPENIQGDAIYNLRIYTDIGGTLSVGTEEDTVASRISPLSHKSVQAPNVVKFESVTSEIAVVTRTTTLHSPMVNPVVPPVGLREESRYQFDRFLGLVREVKLDVLATKDSDRRVDRLVIRMVQPPKR